MNNDLNFIGNERRRGFSPDKILISFLIAAISLRLISEYGANASYLIVAFYSLFGRRQAIQALFIAWFFNLINPALAPDAGFASIGRYLIILLAAISVFIRSIKYEELFLINKLNLYTCALGFLMLIHSVLFSVVVDVSILKIMTWLIVMLTLFSAWSGLAIDHRRRLFRQLELALIILILLSVPLLFVPSIGYLRNGTGFQGVLNQPQAFGITVALLGALLGGRILGKSRPALRDMTLFGVCLLMVVLSEARTAGLAMILGLLVSALLAPVFAGVSRRSALPGLRNRRFQLFVLLPLVGIIMLGPFFADRVSAYLYKRSDSTSIIMAAEASRGALVGKMVSNIEQRPLTGIGFGVGSYPEEMEIEREAIFNLPIGAQFEKGVMPIAVIEELGLIGAIFIILWFYYVFRKVARAGVSQFSVLITLLLVNLGESMFFSTGGMGMLLLILLTGAVTLEQRA